MKNINIYPIVSSLHDSEYIISQRNKLLAELTSLTGYSFKITSIDDLYKGDFALILVESGGSENYFLQVEDKLKEPFVFLTYMHNNSLAASLEILAYLKRHHKKGEILHGQPSLISKRIIELMEKK